MKPDPQTVLTVIGELINSELPQLAAPSYGLQQLIRGASLLAVIAQEFDGGAAWRHEENQALRSLFRDALPAVDVEALRARLRDAADGEDRDLGVASLDAGNQQLRSLMIDLQVWSETAGAPAAPAIGEAIWAELRRSTERRRRPLDRF